MEPNKLETQIREKLNARQLQPSDKAWDRLDAMLSVAEKKNKKSNFKWLYIAAGIVGFLFVGLVFYNQESTAIDTNNNTVVQGNSVDKKEKTEVNKSLITKKEVEISNNTMQKVVAEVKVKSKKQESKALKIQNFTDTKTSNNTIVAQTVSENKIEKTTLTVNPEALLAAVEPEKQTIQMGNKPKLQIDPKILLSQVDGEIELTFRQKVIKTINKNYDSAKLSLASRNQE